MAGTKSGISVPKVALNMESGTKSGVSVPEGIFQDASAAVNVAGYLIV